MITEEAIRILYEMLSKTAYNGGELGGLAVEMAVEALRKQENQVDAALEGVKEKKISQFTWRDIQDIYCILLNVQGETDEDYLETLSIPERIENEHREYKKTLKRYLKLKEEVWYQKLREKEND